MRGSKERGEQVVGRGQVQVQVQMDGSRHAIVLLHFDAHQPTPLPPAAGKTGPPPSDLSTAVAFPTLRVGHFFKKSPLHPLHFCFTRLSTWLPARNAYPDYLCIIYCRMPSPCRNTITPWTRDLRAHQNCNQSSS